MTKEPAYIRNRKALTTGDPKIELLKSSRGSFSELAIEQPSFCLAQRWKRIYNIF